MNPEGIRLEDYKSSSSDDERDKLEFMAAKVVQDIKVYTSSKSFEYHSNDYNSDEVAVYRRLLSLRRLEK